MKNVLLLLLVGVCVYQYMNPRTVEVIKEVRVPVATRVAQGPRMFYHSPLDAPAMPVSFHTGMGYFSTDTNSRFASVTQTSYNRTAGGYSTTRPAVSSVDSVNPLASVEMLQAKMAEQP